MLEARYQFQTRLLSRIEQMFTSRRILWILKFLNTCIQVFTFARNDWLSWNFFPLIFIRKKN